MKGQFQVMHDGYKNYYNQIGTIPANIFLPCFLCTIFSIKKMFLLLFLSKFTDQQIDGFTFEEMPSSEFKKLITTVGDRAKRFKLQEELRKVEGSIKNC